MRRVWAVVLVVFLAPSARAQLEADGVHTACRLPVLAEDGMGRRPGRARVMRDEPCPPAQQAARFEVTYRGFPLAAERTFQAAVDTWACRLRADQPIRIQASWSSLDRGTLGTAGPYLYRNFEGASARDVWYPAALVDQIVGRTLDADQPHIEATFNSDFEGWHLDLTPPPDGAYDLFTVVLHELGHGLGFIGAMTVEDGRGRVGSDPEGPYVYDLLSQDAEGRSLLNGAVYPDGSLALGSVLQDEVLLSGPALAAVSTQSTVLYSPSRWQPGGSYSHLDEDAYPFGTPDGLMTPFVGRSEAIDAPGAVTCAALADIGWELAGECAALVGPTLPRNEGDIVIQRSGPNPVRQSTAFRLSSPALRPVTASLYDVLGRQVAVVGKTVLVPGQDHEMWVDVGQLAAGVYVLVVTGGPTARAVTVAVVR